MFAFVFKIVSNVNAKVKNNPIAVNEFLKKNFTFTRFAFSVFVSVVSNLFCKFACL